MITKVSRQLFRNLSPLFLTAFVGINYLILCINKLDYNNKPTTDSRWLTTAMAYCLCILTDVTNAGWQGSAPLDTEGPRLTNALISRSKPSMSLGQGKRKTELYALTIQNLQPGSDKYHFHCHHWPGGLHGPI